MRSQSTLCLLYEETVSIHMTVDLKHITMCVCQSGEHRAGAGAAGPGNVSGPEPRPHRAAHLLQRRPGEDHRPAQQRCQTDLQVSSGAVRQTDLQVSSGAVGPCSASLSLNYEKMVKPAERQSASCFHQLMFVYMSAIENCGNNNRRVLLNSWSSN